MLASCGTDKPSEKSDGVSANDAQTTENSIFQSVQCGLKSLDYSDFIISQALGGNYLGNKAEYKDGDGMVYEECFADMSTGKITELSYPSDLPDWYVASGDTAVMQNRYVYEWKSYTSMFSEDALHDVRLTRIDGKTGEVEVVDKAEQSSPFVYLCKINDSEFLSYSILQVPSDKTDYATRTTAAIYNINGEKTEIICETYENGADWTDSEGILIERFAVNNGEIYGIGRRRINGKYRFFLYHYSKSGDLIETKPLDNLENIIGDEQFAEVFLVGDYIVFKTYETLSTYICKITPSGVEKVVEGVDGAVQFAVCENRIFYIESTVDLYTGEVRKTDCPLYELDAESGKTRKIKFSAPFDKPYFVNIKALLNGEIILTYCPDGIYDPMKQEQFAVVM